MSKIQGTGLGMAITKIWSMMGGCISVESEPGKASEFYGFPCAFPSAESRLRAAAYPPALRVCALVADDDIPDTCLNVSKMLRMIGTRSDWTTSGHEAVVRTQDAIEQGDGLRCLYHRLDDTRSERS